MCFCLLKLLHSAPGCVSPIFGSASAVLLRREEDAPCPRLSLEVRSIHLPASQSSPTSRKKGTAASFTSFEDQA